MKPAIILICISLTIFLAYRFIRPLQIFVVSPEFEMPIDIGKVPDGLESVSAEECGLCHQEIYEEWASTMHANAWIDPYFQADYAFDGKLQICLNCHTPLKDQQENLVLGYRDRDKFEPILKPNSDFDASLQAEGVTCAVCHVKDGVIIGPSGGDTAPHPVKRDESMSDGHSLCRRCHMVTGKRWDTFYRLPPCGTYGETAEAGRKPECMKCHMPGTRRAIIPGGEVRSARRHLWRGGHDPDMVRSALTIGLEKVEGDGEGNDYSLTLTNSGANHRVPTGTPDRHLTVKFTLLDHDLEIIREKVYRMKRTLMWRPFIVDLWDTRLMAGESRSFPFSVIRGDGAAFLDVEVRYHLLDEKRRRRIAYENRGPIDYRIFYRRVEMTRGK